MWNVPSSVIFCSSCILLLPGICCIYFSNPFFVSPRTPVTTGIVVAFIPHIVSISISRSLFFDSFSVTWTEVFFSVGVDISISRQLFSCLFLKTMSALLAFISLAVSISISWQDCDVVSLVPRPVRAIRVTRVGLEPRATVWGSCSYHFSFPALWSLLSYVKILNWKKYILASILVNNQF